MKNVLLVQPTPEQQIHIRKTFNEDENIRDQALDTIKNWLRKQPHLPDTWDEHRLLIFLKGCHFSLELCKKKLDMYFTVRTHIPEFFSHRDITSPDLQKVLSIVDGAVLPGLTPDFARVSVCRASKQDFDTPNMADVIKVTFMIGDIRMGMEETGVAYDIYIVDVGFPLAKHFFNVNPLVFKKMFVCIQEAYPVIIKQIHIVNASSFIYTAINTVKPFLGETLSKTIHVHMGVETLYDFVPKEILPEEYGGTAGKLVDFKRQWLKKLEESRAWFKQEESVKADETKRVQQDINYNAVFGMEGSFRKLSVD
jgi:hypothetical protein